MSTIIEIVNLKCNGCVNTVKKGVLSIDGINEVDVDLEASKVKVPTENKELIEQVKAKLSKMGYPELGDANTMLHKAKSFVSCASGKMTIESE
ncbi:MAG: heavy-metal-associated domain-containing protein [Flavobacteriaceae bacterium]|nr:heavy-metal-associated domain-containing protein [Flavobacteriaceae bacterium]